MKWYTWRAPYERGSCLNTEFKLPVVYLTTNDYKKSPYILRFPPPFPHLQVKIFVYRGFLMTVLRTIFTHFINFNYCNINYLSFFFFFLSCNKFYLCDTKRSPCKNEIVRFFKTFRKTQKQNVLKILY